MNASARNDWQYKPTDEWSADDLASWVRSLNTTIIGPQDQGKIVDAIRNNSYAASDVMEEPAQDIADAFGTSVAAASHVLSKLAAFEPTSKEDLQRPSSTQSQVHEQGDVDMKEEKQHAHAEPSDGVEFFDDFVGYRLDYYKADKNVWCSAEISGVDVEHRIITINCVNWSWAPKDNLKFEDASKMLVEYGMLAYKGTKSVVDKREKKHFPTPQQAKAVRQKQSEKLRILFDAVDNCAKAASSTFWQRGADHVKSFLFSSSNNNNNSTTITNNSSSSNNNNSSSSNNNNSSSNYRRSGTGLIGLPNLGNTCYMNSAIQLIAHTPPLQQSLFFRDANADVYPRDMGKPLISVFIELCHAAEHGNYFYNTYKIKALLAREDSQSFAGNLQQDSGHALSKLLEVLDRELVNNGHYVSNPIVFDRKLGPEAEDTLIDKLMREINPNNMSIIRDKMSFILREEFSCLEPGCTYREYRYLHEQKLQLPLQNRNVDAEVCIVLPDSCSRIRKQFSLVDYCGLVTLKAQIRGCLDLKWSGNEIDIYELNVDQIKQSIKGACNLTPLPSATKCSDLRNKQLHAIVKPDINIADSARFVYIHQFYLCADENGELTNALFCVRVAAVGTPITQTSISQFPFGNQRARVVYYNGAVVLNSNDDEEDSKHETSSVVRPECSSMVILCAPAKVKQDTMVDTLLHISTSSSVQFNLTQIAPWIHAHLHATLLPQQRDDFRDVVRQLNLFLQSVDKFVPQRVYGKPPDMQSTKGEIEFALEQYKQLLANQRLVFGLISTLSFGHVSGNGSKSPVTPFQNIDQCLQAYFGDQVLDQGVILHCDRCHKQSSVCRKSTQIVRFPEIATVLFDRFDFATGRKYNGHVAYGHTTQLAHPNQSVVYDLFGVSNHLSSNISSGHYNAYVKSEDNNGYAWYEANDRRISSINGKTAAKSKDAIILMFQKQ